MKLTIQELKSKYPEVIERRGRCPYGYVPDSEGGWKFHANWQKLGELDDALNRLDNGESLREVLGSFPELGKSMLHKLWKQYRPNSQRNYDLRKQKIELQEDRKERIRKAPDLIRKALKEERRKKEEVRRSKIKIARTQARLEKLVGEEQKATETRTFFAEAFKAPVLALGDFISKGTIASG